MKIAFVDTLGLTYDGSTLSKRGLGGSESALILISKELHKLGFDVHVFNDCTSDDSMPGVYDGVLFRPLHEVETAQEHFDIVIGSRSVAAFAPVEMRDRFKNFIGGLPDFTNLLSRSRHRVLWMHDTFCDGDDLIEYFCNTGRINEIMTLSDWHLMYATTCDHGVKRNFDILKPHMFLTRNGIGNMPKEWIDVTQKDPNLFVYNSSVTKGMIPLVTKAWPEIKARCPEAKLKVIGGYYKFRQDAAPDQQEQDWHNLVAEWSGKGLDIEFTGIIKQSEISEILRKASFMAYPAAFPETFGISTLEALAHNVPLITCRFGALEETAIDAACYKMRYTVQKNWSCQWLDEDVQIASFVESCVQAYNNRYLHQQKMYACNQVKDICGWDTVALQWKQHFYKKLGEYLPVYEYRHVTKINNRVREVFGRRFLNLEEIPERVAPPFNRIQVITPVYNAASYIEKCIASVAQQDYPYYTMYIIDDCSTDGTADVAEKYIKSLHPSLQQNFVIIINDENLGAVRNQVEAIRDRCGDDIVMLLDGDDWLVNDPLLFHKYNNLYNEGAEFTYGSCWSVVDNIPLVAQEYPPHIRQTKAYRDYKFNWNMPYTHLRTFRASMMHGYLHTYGYDAFKDGEGNWLKAGGDTAVFYSMIEYADPERVVCIPDIVYNYNDANPLNDYKINSEEQTRTAEAVLNKSPFKPGQTDLRPL